MSLGPQKQNENMPRSQQGSITANSRKRSDSTSEVASYFKQKLDEHNPSETNEQLEQFDEDIYNDLSSGVYQMSGKQQKQQQRSEERQYFSQQIKIGDELPQQKYEQCVRQSKHQTQVISEQRYQEVEEDVEQFMQKVLSPKLQSQEVLHSNQQGEFAYPSLMQQSNAENGCNGEQQLAPSIKYQQMQVQTKPFFLESNIHPYQQMNIQVNVMPKNMPLKFNQSQKAPQTEDLLNIKNDQKPITVKPKMHTIRVQQQVSDEECLQEPTKIVAIDQSTKLRILGYEKEYFLKIETQVYQIQFCSPTKSYTFNRKFADFMLLDRLIRLKYPGYILYPFPENSLEFFNKIKLSVGTQMEKVVLIEKRLLQLEKYLNYILNHKELGVSQVFQTFIAEQDGRFARHIAYLQNLVDRQQQKFGTSKIRQNYKSIKNFVFSGLSYFTSYVSNNQKNIQNSSLLDQLRRKSQSLKQNFDEIIVQLQKNRLLTSNIQIKTEKLIEIYQGNIQMKPIESSIDSVLVLSAKMASSKTAYQLHKSWVQDKMLSKIYFFVNVFTQVQDQIQYRKSLLLKADSLEQNEAKLGISIIERVQAFDSRFVEDWNQLKVRFQKQYIEMIEQFSKQWLFHCSQMSKIWK